MIVTFASEFWLKVAYGLAFFTFLFWIIEKIKWKKLNGKLNQRLGPILLQSVSVRKKFWHLWLQGFVLVLLCVALARPQLGSQQTEIKSQGLEMIIAIDVSRSMLAEDDKPSRLALAKKKIIKFLDTLHGDRVGLIAFAGSAVLLSPMTSDYGAIKLFTESLTTDSVSTQGTDFKSVLETSIGAFDRGGIENPTVTPTRVLIVASDGEDNEPGASSALKKAVENGIRVFTIGFGTRQGAPIPLRDERGNLTDYLKKKGEIVMSIPSEEGLTKLAQDGGGAFYHSTYDDSDIQAIYQDISKLQRAELASKMSMDYDEKYQIPLAIGIFLGLLEMSFGNRRKSRLAWRGRFEASA